MEGFSDGSSTLPASTKTKGHPKGCPFVLGSDRRRRSPPFGDSNARDGKAIPPPRFCLRQNARTPQKRRGPEGPLGNISRWQIENLKYLDCSALPKRKDIRKDVLSFWAPTAEGGLRPSVIQMLGMAKPSLRRGFASGKTLVRRKSGAAQKGRWARSQDSKSKI